MSEMPTVSSQALGSSAMFLTLFMSLTGNHFLTVGLVLYAVVFLVCPRLVGAINTSHPPSWD
jgi:hypothetical protein